jgi:pyruvate dehydrogenase E2 component (dihydrolipoamide acetyltransferase)
LNAAAPILRRAASPHARKLARDRTIALDDLVGSGPGGRIVAADVIAWRAPVASTEPQPQAPKPARLPLIFSAAVSLADFHRLAAQAALVGLTLEVEDAALRAAGVALEGLAGAAGAGVAVEANGRQILIGAASGLSIGTQRRLRQEALERGADVSAAPAAASLLVMHSTRIVPVSVPLLPGRAMRLVLLVDRGLEQGNALLCADGDAVTEAQALELLESFVRALEQPLALMA